MEKDDLELLRSIEGMLAECASGEGPMTLSELDDLLTAIASDPESFSLDTPKKTKIGRNEPCHCGSRQKYKKCCIRSLA